MKIAQDEIRGKRPQPGFASWRDAVNLSFPLDQLHAIALDSVRRPAVGTHRQRWRFRQFEDLNCSVVKNGDAAAGGRNGNIAPGIERRSG